LAPWGKVWPTAGIGGAEIEGAYLTPPGETTMSKRRVLSDDDGRAIIAGFTRKDFERLNRLAHAKNLRSIIKCTKWLNDHGVELLRRYPQEFRDGTGMTVEQYLHALTVHIDCCRAFLKKSGGLEVM
jgi:hypothetical protein